MHKNMQKSPISHAEDELLKSQDKAAILFSEAVQRGMIRAGVTEKELSDKIYKLAHELFGIKKYWHKRVVRAGVNTLCPYRENPPNLTIQENDLVFFDFGPVFEDWEADFGRTFLVGEDPSKRRMIDDLEIVFLETKKFFQEKPNVTGHELFDYIVRSSKQHGWPYGGPHAGHLIGEFPHEKRLGECPENYICSENETSMQEHDMNGEERHWILEVHLVDLEKKYGAFYEDLLTITRPFIS